MAVKRSFPDYPTSWGSSRASVFPHVGPTSYTQVTRNGATGLTGGGDSLTFQPEAGFKWGDVVMQGVTDSGNFEVLPIPIVPSSTSNAQSGQQAQTYRLLWRSMVTATIGGQNQTAGAEAVAATNLSAETVRLLAVGPK